MIVETAVQQKVDTLDVLVEAITKVVEDIRKGKSTSRATLTAEAAVHVSPKTLERIVLLAKIDASVSLEPIEEANNGSVRNVDLVCTLRQP